MNPLGHNKPIFNANRNHYSRHQTSFFLDSNYDLISTSEKEAAVPEVSFSYEKVQNYKRILSGQDTFSGPMSLYVMQRLKQGLPLIGHQNLKNLDRGSLKNSMSDRSINSRSNKNKSLLSLDNSTILGS